MTLRMLFNRIRYNLSMARVANEPWRLYRPSALMPERIHDRVKGYEGFERWDAVLRPDVGGA
jgi:hypothetical protein